LTGNEREAKSTSDTHRFELIEALDTINLIIYRIFKDFYFIFIILFLFLKKGD